MPKLEYDDLALFGPLPKSKITPTIDQEIHNRVRNEDGSVSTIRTMSFNDGTGEILIPTVVGDKILPEKEAIDHYYKTGEHFGVYENPADAEMMAQYLHLLHEQKLANESRKNER